MLTHFNVHAKVLTRTLGSEVPNWELRSPTYVCRIFGTCGASGGNFFRSEMAPPETVVISMKVRGVQAEKVTLRNFAKNRPKGC